MTSFWFNMEWYSGINCCEAACWNKHRMFSSHGYMRVRSACHIETEKRTTKPFSLGIPAPGQDNTLRRRFPIELITQEWMQKGTFECDICNSVSVCVLGNEHICEGPTNHTHCYPRINPPFLEQTFDISSVWWMICSYTRMVRCRVRGICWKYMDN